MATIGASPRTFFGPLVDRNSTYSAIGQAELKLLADHLVLRLNPSLALIPEQLKGYNHWQYGKENHACQPRNTIGSYVISARTDYGNTIRITHLVLDGSPQ